MATAPVTKEVIWTDRLMVPIAHFSHAAKVGDFVYVGATAGTDAQRRLAGEAIGRVDARAQTEQMFDNLATALGLLGASLENVVRIKTYITDIRDADMYQDVFRKRLGDVAPSHAIVGSHGFPLPQAAIELDVTALIGTGRPERYVTAMPTRADGTIAAGDVAQQAAQALRNLAAGLEAFKLGLRDIVSVHVTIPDLRDFAAFETVYREAMAAPYPARTVVGAPLSRPDMLLQIEAVAVPGGGQPIGSSVALAQSLAASPAMLAGDVLYISGQLGLGADGRLSGDAEAQTNAAWTRVHRLVQEAGLDRDSVLRTNNVLTDWRWYGGFNAGYGANTRDPYPPRTTVLGTLIDPRAFVQVEAEAHRGGERATIVQAVGFK